MGHAPNAVILLKLGYQRMKSKKKVEFKDATIKVLSFSDIKEFNKYAQKTFERQFTRFLLPREIGEFVYLDNNEEFKKLINEKVIDDFIFDKETMKEEVDEEDYAAIEKFPDGVLIKGKYKEDEGRGSRLIVIDPKETYLKVLDFIMDFSSDHFYFLVDDIFLAFSD